MPAGLADGSPDAVSLTAGGNGIRIGAPCAEDSTALGRTQQDKHGAQSSIGRQPDRLPYPNSRPRSGQLRRINPAIDAGSAWWAIQVLSGTRVSRGKRGLAMMGAGADLVSVKTTQLSGTDVTFITSSPSCLLCQKPSLSTASPTHLHLCAIPFQCLLSPRVYRSQSPPPPSTLAVSGVSRRTRCSVGRASQESLAFFGSGLLHRIG